MKRILTLLVAVIATVNLSAQDLRWGPTAGINFAWAHFSNKASTSDCYIGFNAGVKAEYDMSQYITDGFLLDARLLYTLKGGQWAGSQHHNLGYLELPINLTYRYDLGGDVKLFGGLGPYLGLGVLGKHVQKVDGAKVKSDLFGELYKRFDFGLNYNLGVEMWDNWQFFIGFEHSLLNSMKSGGDFPDGGDGGDHKKFKMRPLNFYIGTAFMF